MKNVLLPLSALLAAANATSWVFWACDVFDNFCLEGSTCVTQSSLWVQYSDANGGGDVQKSGGAQDPDTGASYYCPIDNARSSNENSDDNFVGYYRQYDPSLPGGGDVNEYDPCPEGTLFEADGTTVLGQNDGSGTLPPSGGGDGFCPSSASCNCVAHVTVND